MTLRVDLHMHSCLSPCGDMEMTPNNIVNMAWIKGLDAIAVADHNRARHVRACAAVAQERDLLVLPALEVTTREEVHVLCYFPRVELAEAFDDWLYQTLPARQNRPAFFGEQALMDAQDVRIGEESRLLLQACGVSLAELAARAREMGGLAVPAHINRPADGLLGVLGLLPADVDFPTLEVDPRMEMPPGVPLADHLVLHASDAHTLEAIAEPGHLLEVPERSVQALFDTLQRGKPGA